MSKGIGRAQRLILARLAAVDEVQHRGALLNQLMALAGDVNRANLYRELRTLERRELVTFTDTANRTTDCRRCHHRPEDHGDRRYWCMYGHEPPWTRACRCGGYRATVTPRARWCIALTPSGHASVPRELLPPIVEDFRAAVQRLESYEQMIAKLATALSR
jgi:hypothetical protein